jgi:predicted Co/Zn/Cd cation transporter (cation efflux family)
MVVHPLKIQIVVDPSILSIFKTSILVHPLGMIVKTADDISILAVRMIQTHFERIRNAIETRFEYVRSSSHYSNRRSSFHPFNIQMVVHPFILSVFKTSILSICTYVFDMVVHPPSRPRFAPNPRS